MENMKVCTGTYTGNDVDDRDIPIPFDLSLSDPWLIIIRRASNAHPVWATSAMPAGDALLLAGNAGIQTDTIQAVGNGFFQIGTAATVNNNTSIFHYVVVQGNGENDFNVGTYIANDSANRSITGLGFDPNVVLVKTTASSAGSMQFRSTPMPIDTSYQLIDGTQIATGIRDLITDGFTVGNNAATNLGTARVYYWIAFKNVSGLFDEFSYTGDLVDDRQITDPGFQPVFTIVDGNSSVGRMKIDTMGAGNAFNVTNGPVEINSIQNFISSGIEIGSAAAVNNTGVVYYGFAIKENLTERRIFNIS